MKRKELPQRGNLGLPPCAKNSQDFEPSSLAILFLQGTFGPNRPDFDLGLVGQFRPVLTSFRKFRPLDLTYFHPFRPTSFHDKAPQWTPPFGIPWTCYSGHLGPLGPKSASSEPTTEFAQPCLSRVKGQSSPARGYKFGCVCSYMASHYVGVR